MDSKAQRPSIPPSLPRGGDSCARPPRSSRSGSRICLKDPLHLDMNGLIHEQASHIGGEPRERSADAVPQRDAGLKALRERLILLLSNTQLHALSPNRPPPSAAPLSR